MRGRCTTCDRPIEWAKYLHSRKWIPLDPGSVADGNLEVPRRDLDGYPLVRLVPLGERDGRFDLRRTHFATCPDATVHRRPA